MMNDAETTVFCTEACVLSLNCFLLAIQVLHVYCVSFLTQNKKIETSVLV